MHFFRTGFGRENIFAVATWQQKSQIMTNRHALLTCSVGYRDRNDSCGNRDKTVSDGLDQLIRSGRKRASSAVYSVGVIQHLFSNFFSQRGPFPLITKKTKKNT